MENIVGNLTVSAEAVAHYNLLLTQAMFDVLEMKGLLTKAEVSARLQVLKQEVGFNIAPMQ